MYLHTCISVPQNGSEDPDPRFLRSEDLSYLNGYFIEVYFTDTLFTDNQFIKKFILKTIHFIDVSFCRQSLTSDSEVICY